MPWKEITQVEQRRSFIHAVFLRRKSMAQLCIACWLWFTSSLLSRISASSVLALLAAASGAPMKKAVSEGDDTMRAEYDFSGGERGKYASRYARGSNVVVLEPDVAEAFPTARAVNAALRKVLRDKQPRTRRAARRGSA